MTVTEQKAFIVELIGNVQKSILDHAYDMPSNWNGIELRQYIADRFAREAYPMECARLRNYRNAIAVTTL